LRQDEATIDLLQAVLASDNLARAWKRVKANKGAPGIDGVTIADFPAHARAHWPAVREQIDQGRYQPQAVRRVQIPKPDGGQRLLGLPTVTDRVVQQAIAQVLTPIFEATFSDSSFGFRPGRNAHQAIRQVQANVKDGRRIAVDIDLAKFFDTVNHDVPMSLLGRTIRDKRLLGLIGRYLRAGVLVGEHIEPSEVGTPQGGPLSPLLANIVLHQLDRELEQRGHRFARYADDMIILVKSRRAAERVMRSITRTSVRGTKIRWTDKSVAQFKHRVRELTGRSWGVPMDHRLHKLGQYVRGWTAYYGISQYYRPVPELEDWIRRRIRTNDVRTRIAVSAFAPGRSCRKDERR
jgi:RNA-directed DNA polymerase